MQACVSCIAVPLASIAHHMDVWRFATSRKKHDATLANLGLDSQLDDPHNECEQ